MLTAKKRIWRGKRNNRTTLFRGLILRLLHDFFCYLCKVLLFIHSRGLRCPSCDRKTMDKFKRWRKVSFRTKLRSRTRFILTPSVRVSSHFFRQSLILTGFAFCIKLVKWTNAFQVNYGGWVVELALEIFIYIYIYSIYRQTFGDGLFLFPPTA